MRSDRIAELLDVYRLIRDSVDHEEAVRLISENAPRNDIIVYREDGEVVGVCIGWHVADPLDVGKKVIYPGEDPQGKYLFFPFFYVRADRRDVTGRIIKLLFQKARERARGVPSRFSYIRKGRLVILESA